jgi:GT2 family glycosyltransferase
MIFDEIGAVVIGRNEGKRLIDCIESVRFNVRWLVYVDSGSIDGSTQRAGDLGAHVVILNPSQPFTAARARNEGFEALLGLRPDIQFVQFLDGDCELDKNWLTTAAAFMEQHNDVAIVCGRRQERHPSASIYNQLCDIEWDTPIGQTLACGGDSLIRANAFETVGGFRGQLIGGEEPELCIRLRENGWKIWRIDTNMSLHDAALTRFSQWWLRTTRFGYGMTEVLQLHWQSPRALWKPELARAVLWGGVLPVFIGIISLMHPVAIATVLIYPIQVCRIAVTRRSTSCAPWIYASFMTLAKFAEVQGILTFYWRKLHRKSVKWIDYK